MMYACFVFHGKRSYSKIIILRRNELTINTVTNKQKLLPQLLLLIITLLMDTDIYHKKKVIGTRVISTNVFPPVREPTR